ncbi:response regulator [Pelagibacterium sp.]|uniref:response regulator n=1 Tax=Pelagibacterium sp. TaxID=1967288 RepID=UPI003BAB5235
MSNLLFALVVEDDFLIAMDAIRILNALGYQTMAVGDADAAMEVLSHRTDVDLLFTDIDIPGTTNGIGVA